MDVGNNIAIIKYLGGENKISAILYTTDKILKPLKHTSVLYKKIY